MKNGIKGAICAGSLLLTVNAFATSTGLNNIPTVDTPPDRTLVIQAFDNLGDDRRPDYVAGFKMGLRPWGQRFEWGLDGRLGSGDEGPAVFQVKYAVQPWEKLPTVALGAANIAVTEDDRRRGAGVQIRGVDAGFPMASRPRRVRIPERQQCGVLRTGQDAEGAGARPDAAQ